MLRFLALHLMHAAEQRATEERGEPTRAERPLDRQRRDATEDGIKTFLVAHCADWGGMVLFVGLVLWLSGAFGD